MHRGNPDEMGEGLDESEQIQKDIARLKELKNIELRILVESFYDLQKLRIAMGNRIRAYTAEGLIEYIDPGPSFQKLREAEKELEKEIGRVIKKHPLWDSWFKGVKGIGPIMAAGTIAWRDDISKARTVSAFWKFHGFAPTQSRRKKGEKLDYSPKAKVQMWKAGMQLLKARGPYTEVYYKAKAEYEQRQDIKDMHETVIGTKMVKGKEMKVYKARGGPLSYKLHLHNMALRKMIKRYLADTWVMWRQEEGLPVTEPYIFGEAAVRKGIAHEHYEDPRKGVVKG